MTRLLLAVILIAVTVQPASAQDVQPDSTLFTSLKWRNIGPFRGGRSNAVTGVVQQPTTFYFGGVGSGVWKTDDAGQNWSNVSDDAFGTSSVGAIAVAPSDPNVVYVGMGEHAVRGVMTSHGDGVYRSTDAGRSWTHVGLPGSRAISRIHVHPSDPDLVYVAVQGAPYGPTEERGVYRTEDGGTTWENILYVSDTAGASDLAMDPNNPRILYAAFWDHQRFPWQVRSGGEGSGFHRSTDGGDSWTSINEGLPELMGKTDITVAANSDRLYALVEADPGGGLYRSEDRGKTWRNVNQNWSLRARAWYYINVFADPVNPDEVWILNAPAFKSIDGGRSFQRVATPHGDNHDLWIHPENPDIVINANDGGANVSLNGGRTWSTQQNQPTAQFYRVNTDNRFPYHVYGGQQDNSAIAIASESPGAGIGWKDWYSVAGCETAYAAFDPDNPTSVLGGCYMGIIGRWDAATSSSRDAMAYTNLPIALASRDMKYRFNWNAPIIASRHDPSVMYHAANVLLRTTDQGLTWTEASPDLTRDNDERQGPGGGPITNEGAGGEIYGTIMYVAESPHSPDVIWTGSDDGLVHMTRDGGESWTNVTPDGLPEAQVNAIDVSPHDPAAAYIAVTAYKVNDFTPRLYRTRDFGASWDLITDGISEDHHTRVVREDPRVRGLLYAGAENGLYVSWNDGDDWHSLQMNMPITPITDLMVQREHNDLVVATGGRSFWILDDLAPLQQQAGVDGLHLFQPDPAHRVAGGQGDGRARPGLGQNPMPGVVIDFFAPDLTDSSSVLVEILDDDGEVLRTYGNGPSAAVGADTLKFSPGHNRMSWDLRKEAVQNVQGLYVWGTLRGMRAIPGTYAVRLVVDEDTLTTSAEVLPDPRIDTNAYGEQDAFGAEVTETLTAIHDGIRDLRNVRGQIQDFLGRTPEDAALDSLGQALIESLNDIEEAVVQKRTVDGQTVINWPSRIRERLIYLRGAVDGADGEVTQGTRAAFADLSAAWQTQRALLDDALGARLDGFNAAVSEKQVPAIVLPQR
ncbi:MAG: hypothetical protein JJ896_17580 [Rhodothermales bacterium]|nr:hypothetical protein [Rhodothermales bacterium]MBO6781473.1 hypothetical protein [Rhodothermales bacterium]